MKRCHQLTLMAVTILLCSCSNAPKTKAEISLKPYIESIEVVTLETKPESLLTSIRAEDVNISDSCIIISDVTGEKIFRFNRKGKFEYTIGNRGRAANEFYYNHSSVFLSKYGIYVQKESDRYIRYSFDGKFLGTVPDVKSDPQKSMLEQGAPSARYTFDDDHIAVYFCNTIGTVSDLLGIYNAESGELVYMHKNPNMSSTPHNFVFSAGGDIGYSHRGKFYFKENKSDTIFEVTKSSMNPHFIINKSISTSFKDGRTMMYIYDSLIIASGWSKKTDRLVGYIINLKTQQADLITDSVDSKIMDTNPAKFGDNILLIMIPAKDYNQLPVGSIYRTDSIKVSDDDNPLLIICRLK